jgi:hypothetical protein
LVTGEFPSGHWWGAAKRGLTFAKLTQDGDDEGALILDRLPTSEEAVAIRHYCGIPKKRAVNAAERERLKGMGRRFAASPPDVVCDGAAEKPAPADPAGVMI